MKYLKLRSLIVMVWVIAVYTAALSSQSLESRSRVDPPRKCAYYPAAQDDEFRYWDRGVLISYQHRASESEPAVVVYGETGAVQQRGNVWLKDSTEMMITHAAVNASGRLFVSGAARDAKNAIAYFIASIDSQGNVDKVLRTNPFVPQQICPVEDGTVWALGFDREVDEQRVDQDYDLLRHYSIDTGKLSQTLSRSLLAKPGRVYPLQSIMRCNSAEIGVYTGLDHEWISVDMGTQSVRVWKMPELKFNEERLTGLAFFSPAKPYVSIVNQKRGTSGLYEFVVTANGTGEWLPVSETIKPIEKSVVARLLGGDRDTLVISQACMSTRSKHSASLACYRIDNLRFFSE